MSRSLPPLPSRKRPATARPAGGAAAMFGDLAQAGRLRRVRLDAIVANPRQPRQRFDKDALQNLAQSIALRGVLQPPVVREHSSGQLELIAGERRWRASRLAGLDEIDVLVRDTDDSGALEDAVMENVARQDLSPVEEARAYVTMVEDLGLTREQVGERVGQSRVSISNHIRLLDLPDEALELLDTGTLTFAHGRALLLCDEQSTRRALARRAVIERWSTRELEDAARAAGAPRARKPRRRQSADHQALAQRLGDAASRAAGVDVRARAAGKDAYTLTLHGHDAAAALLRHFGVDIDDTPL